MKVDLKLENEKLKEEKIEMRKEIEDLKRKIDVMMEEQKEMGLEMDVLRSENKRLKREGVDVSCYEKWNYEGMIEWILSLENGRFEKYVDKLKIAFKQEGLSGMDLVGLKENDLIRWRVDDVSDRTDLLGHIKNLCEKNVTDDYCPDLNSALSC